MELRAFVADTLAQIQEGVQDAICRRSSASDSAGVINPVFGKDMDAAGDRHVQKVEFDIAVTVTEKTKRGGKAEIKVLSIGLDGDRSKEATHSAVTRIKFAVPVIPPVQLVKPDNRVAKSSVVKAAE